MCLNQMSNPVVISLYRNLLRLAAIHDHNPSYKFMMASFRSHKRFNDVESTTYFPKWMQRAFGTKKGTSCRYTTSSSLVDTVKEIFRENQGLDDDGRYSTLLYACLRNAATSAHFSTTRHTTSCMY